MSDLETLLKSNGVDVNYSDDQGCTLLMKSAKNGSVENVNTLLQYGAKVHLLDYKSLSALYHATASNELNVVKALVEGGAKITSEIYMKSVLNNFKKITLYFDSLDKAKQIINEVKN